MMPKDSLLANKWVLFWACVSISEPPVFLSHFPPQHLRDDTAVGVTSLSFSHFEPTVFVIGTEGGLLLKCSTAAETVAVLQKGSSVPLKAPAQFVFASRGGPVYCVSCSPFHRQVASCEFWHISGKAGKWWY